MSAYPIRYIQSLNVSITAYPYSLGSLGLFWSLPIKKYVPAAIIKVPLCLTASCLL